jgi:SWIM zinc finger
MSQRVLEPPENLPGLRPDECLIEVAALVEQRTHAAGVGWRVTVAGRREAAEARTLRRAGTRMAAELTALRGGLRRAAPFPAAALRLRIADPRTAALLEGRGAGRYQRAQVAAERLAPLLRRFSSVRFEVKFEPDRELAHLVAEALDAGLHAAAEREEHRVWVMERILERARQVRLERTESGWVANDRYHVQLDPMRCGCPAWAARWAKTPIGARRAQRLPCKHLVALALHEGITVPADLAQLARRAPG